MKFEYSKKPSAIKPYTIPDDVFAAMGRLIRASAEIEDIIGLQLCQVANITEAQSLVLLGKMPVSSRLQLASICANAMGGDAAKAQDICFDKNENFKFLMQCRNVVAHGLLLGLTDEDKVAFRTYDRTGVEGDVVSVQAASYAPEDFAIFAKMAEESIPKLEKILKLGPSRQKRRERGLDPHRKSQPERPPSAKRMRQRKPSRPKP